MDKLLQSLHDKAKEKTMRIILPETDDDRIYHATKQIIEENVATVILIGNKETIEAKASELSVDITKAIIVDNKTSEQRSHYVQELIKLRGHKGVDEAKANDLLNDPVYYGTMMVKLGDADGLVSGASHPTSHTLRPALQIIKTAPGIGVASSYFLMETDLGTFFFADCGFVMQPTVDELVSIALSTAKSAESFGFEPKVAMLSFSTKGSATNPDVEKVRQAVDVVKQKNPNLIVDGELQLDAAIVPEVGKKKCPDSPIQGDANVLVFPDLEAGNIGYKLVERFGHAKAIGPIVQGLALPVNDLSRGCSVEDIVDVVAITAVEAQKVQK